MGQDHSRSVEIGLSYLECRGRAGLSNLEPGPVGIELSGADGQEHEPAFCGMKGSPPRRVFED